MHRIAGSLLCPQVSSQAGYSGLAAGMAASPAGEAVRSALPPGAVAWVRVEGTSVDYPVAELSDGMPDDYYLKHDLWGSASGPGAPTS